MFRTFRLVFTSLFALSANGQKFYTYIQDLGPTTVQLGWGTTDGVNTIGRSSPSHGDATLKVDGRTLSSTLNYVVVGNLLPDHDYTYDISIGTQKVGAGEFRTWPEKADRVCFFVIGDYGTGQSPQYRVAEAMWQEFQKRQKTGNPVRFMLSTGDNIYGNIATFLFGVAGTGADDRDWESKFFQPYQPLLARIPFFGTLGNHDGNETESGKDTPVYLDNFPFPNGKPARYYSFNYAGLAEFIALDSTRNSDGRRPHPQYGPESEQFRWMKEEMAKPKPAWVIPYYHHPVFNAGPLHAPSLHELQHWVDLFSQSGVKVVFNGHEHNFQMSEVNQASGGIRFITTGAGGELRAGSVQTKMKSANIAAWAPQNHFLLVEIEGKTMRVTPISFEPLSLKDAAGADLKLPIEITLP